jgi:hypothetical protein
MIMISIFFLLNGLVGYCREASSQSFIMLTIFEVERRSSRSMVVGVGVAPMDQLGNREI